MRRWHYGINSYHKHASIYCDEAPRYVFWLYDVVERLCDWAQDLLYIRLLPIKMRLREGWGHEPETIRLDKWFGTIADLIHCYIHLPVFYWCNKKFKKYHIPIGIRRLRKQFYEADKKFWDDEEAIAAEMIEDDKEEK